MEENKDCTQTVEKSTEKTDKVEKVTKNEKSTEKTDKVEKVLEKVLEKVENDTCSNNITLIGIGRLGLCLGLCLEKAGYNVLGVDINSSYVKLINNKKYRSYEPSVDKMLRKSSNLTASISLEKGLSHSDIIMIIVDTPLGGGDNYYDHSKVSNLLHKINEHKVTNKHIVICSTVIPGYINRIGKSLLSECTDTTLNYNPEFIAQGDIINGILTPDLVLIGEQNTEAGDALQEIYAKVCNNLPKFVRLQPLAAELTKIAINGYITTKISYANMISDACDMLHLNKTSVLNAIGTDTRIGNSYFQPGNSFGGPCFPRDTHALAKIMTDVNINPCIINATNEYNNTHCNFQTMQINNSIPEGPITITDVCYKENSSIPIIDESAKLKIAHKLVMHGRKVIIKDKKHMIDLVKMKYGRTFHYEIIN
jgi:UDPglucose 6-dehydrogenase